LCPEPEYPPPDGNSTWDLAPSPRWGDPERLEEVPNSSAGAIDSFHHTRRAARLIKPVDPPGPPLPYCPNSPYICLHYQKSGIYSVLRYRRSACLARIERYHQSHRAVLVMKAVDSISCQTIRDALRQVADFPDEHPRTAEQSKHAAYRRGGHLPEPSRRPPACRCRPVRHPGPCSPEDHPRPPALWHQGLSSPFSPGRLLSKPLTHSEEGLSAGLDRPGPGIFHELPRIRIWGRIAAGHRGVDPARDPDLFHELGLPASGGLSAGLDPSLAFFHAIARR